MYRLGEREHSHRRFYILLAGLAVIIIIGVILGKHYLTANTQISTPPAPVTRKISYDAPPLTTINEKLFSIGVPQGWKAVDTNDVPKPTYTWQGTTGEDKNRWISVYVDAGLQAFAVNRELHVEGNVRTINVVSVTSDNCTSFTGVTAPHGNGTAPAKWEGIDFLCDVGNYARDVVGIVSSDGFNTVNLTGSTGLHHIFFTYTDNSVRPDYSIFTNSLRSFKMN